MITAAGNIPPGQALTGGRKRTHKMRKTRKVRKIHKTHKRQYKHGRK